MDVEPRVLAERHNSNAETPTWIVSEDEEEKGDDELQEGGALETQEQDIITRESRLQVEEMEAENSHSDAFKDLDMEEEDRQFVSLLKTSPLD
jgi:hypothetical protein